jgi:DNA-binding response OmpR family regulator
MQIPWQKAVGMGITWKVALVEDDRRLARALANGLGEVGYTVRLRESGRSWSKVAARG